MTYAIPENGLPGFWLPGNIRAHLINHQEHLTNLTTYAWLSFRNSQPCQPDDSGAITSYYPVLQTSQWQMLLEMLRQNRQRVPTGKACWERLQAALETLSKNFADPHFAPRQQALQSLPAYTGYSEPMIRMTINALDMFALDQMPAALNQQLTWQSAYRWQVMSGLPGGVRFFPTQGWQDILHRLPGLSRQPLFSARSNPELIIGYGAGNVPGAALLIAFLAQAATLASNDPPPALLVKNSRREPIFSPLILHAIEAIDPDLVANLAVLIWDYEDRGLQDTLLSQADLVIAAASDETISQLHDQIQDTQKARRRDSVPSHAPCRLRFHPHGHKVSFSAIGLETLSQGLTDPLTGQPLLDIITLLAALDSIFWDQHGCLSARIHFVEQGQSDFYTAEDYAIRLRDQMHVLAKFLPRGAWPLQQIHDRFDRYKQLEVTGKVQVYTGYQDEFLVILDSRPLTPNSLYSLVNDCQGRVIIVHPVDSLMEIPKQVLRMLPSENLQSLSLAAGRPNQPMDERLLQFVTACGKCGVTAIRSVGRGAFPQLSYSWDGFIPLDLVAEHPAGRFCTYEFDHPYDQILDTYHLMQQRGIALGLI